MLLRLVASLRYGRDNLPFSYSPLAVLADLLVDFRPFEDRGSATSADIRTVQAARSTPAIRPGMGFMANGTNPRYADWQFRHVNHPCPHAVLVTRHLKFPS